jgi:hypothetical protein
MSKMRKMNLTPMTLFLLLMIAAVTTTIAGCSSNEQYSANKADRVDHDNAIRPLSNNNNTGDENARGQTMSDQNPNLLNTNGGADNRGKAINQARGVVNKSADFRPGSIWITADAMYVNVYPKRNLSNNQEVEARAKLHSQLTQALPRFIIEVRVVDDKQR